MSGFTVRLYWQKNYNRLIYCLQTDLFGMIGTIHVLSFLKYMNVYQANGVWRMTSKFKRWVCVCLYVDARVHTYNYFQITNAPLELPVRDLCPIYLFILRDALMVRTVHIQLVRSNLTHICVLWDVSLWGHPSVIYTRCDQY